MAAADKRIAVHGSRVEKQPICNREHVFNLKFYSICTEFYRDFQCYFHSCFITIIICNLHHFPLAVYLQHPLSPSISLSSALFLSYLLVLWRFQCILLKVCHHYLFDTCPAKWWIDTSIHCTTAAKCRCQWFFREYFWQHFKKKTEVDEEVIERIGQDEGFLWNGKFPK